MNRKTLLPTTYLPEGSFITVMIAMMTIFLIVPLFTGSLYAHLLLQVCFLFLLLATLYAVSSERYVAVTGLALLLPYLILEGLSIWGNSLFFLSIAYIFYCLFLSLAIVALSRKVFRMPVIDTNLIFGAVIIYLLIGVLLGKLFFLINFASPNSFRGLAELDRSHSGLIEGYHDQFDLLYFSFTTLTTLGVGDITPVHHLAKSLTIVESIFGQLFVATAIAKMVTSWKRD